jgi:hypothetical protein
MSDDARLVSAKAWLAPCSKHGDVCLVGDPCDRPKHASIPAMLQGVVDFAEERLRVNVGLVMENAELRRQVQDISEGRVADEDNA